MSGLERIYRRRTPADGAISPELARYVLSQSVALNRQIGLLITRSGSVSHVIIGDSKGILIPGLEDYPLGKSPFRGLRLIHTHLFGEPLTKDDLTDLSLLRLDLIAAINTTDEELKNVDAAYLAPGGIERMRIDLYRSDFGFAEFIKALEEETRRRRTFDQSDPRERAVLVSASKRPKYEMEESMDELSELARSSDILLLDRHIQRIKEINPKYLMGEGRLKELVIDGLNKGATLLIFDQDLSPSQIRSISGLTELKVIDRSQLILDIFARRAHSRDGRVQVELAQLNYRLHHLTGKGTAMSRLMGGIGGRGPGEMKLEIDRRRVRDRIHLLEKQLKDLAQARRQRKHRRVDREVPIVSIVGYTNAGKSTLLNGLTKSSTFVEDKMFATLDTASRRLRFPREREVVITDTVGFIRDLPKDLMAAFRATLEELEDADVLIHLIDIGNPRFEQQMESVESILADLGLSDKPRISAFNKADKIDPEMAENIRARRGGVLLSAINPATYGSLLIAIEEAVWGGEKFKAAPV